MMSEIIPILQDTIEQFLHEANETECLDLGYGTIVKLNQCTLPDGITYEGFQVWAGNKKTVEGILDNKFGNFLLLGVDKNRLRNIAIGK